VRYDALEFVSVELLEETRGHGGRGVRGISARGEGVGGRVVDDVNLWHREAGSYHHLLNDVEEDGGVLVGSLVGAGSGEYHPVADVVGGEAGDRSRYEG
jgi:hypothetical protein